MPNSQKKEQISKKAQIGKTLFVHAYLLFEYCGGSKYIYIYIYKNNNKTIIITIIITIIVIIKYD